MTYIGVDSGMDGSFAIIMEDGSIDIVDMPVFAVGKKTKRDYDPAAMAEILMPDHYIRPKECIVGFELLQANPKFGNVTNASLGRCRGIVEGLCAAYGMALHFVTPQAWKKELMPGQPKEKSASILVAKRLFPQAAHFFTLAKHDGRADSLLIAEYTRRRHQGRL